MENQNQLAEATRKVNARILFGIHLAAYVNVNAALIAINLLTSTGHLWFVWPLAGWGVGVLLHGFAILAMTQGASVRQGMIEREMNKRSQLAHK